MTNNPMDMMDFTVDDALEADRLMRARPNERDGRVCICGHAAGRHSTDYGVNQCTPSAMQCSCKTLRPVIESSDVRPFLRKTEGAGPLHALGRGMGVAIAKGATIEWLIELKCDRCGETGIKLTPVPVTQSGVGTNYDTGYNAMLCGECRQAV